MKKRFLLPLLLLLTALLCLSASAAGIGGQVSIASVYDAYGQVSTLTDDATHTTWTKESVGGVDLTLNLYSATVGEIWIRSGHCYSQNYYNSYDRPEVVKVTVWYRANQYTTTSDTYRYRLSDAYRPNTRSSSWNSGYQRILLPKAYSGVTKIELTIESTISGYNRTGATITDIIVARGSHATATPKSYTTATPKPYVVYVTPTPGPNTEPTRDVIVDPVTTMPLIERVTPTPTLAPTRAPSTSYPTSTGIVATLKQRIATRTGPSNNFDEPGSFFSKGDTVNVISKAWDDENEIWWYQVEFYYDKGWYRAYTPAQRIDLDPSYVLTENMEGDPREVLYDQRVYYGPGEEFVMYKVSMLYKESRAVIYAYEIDPDTGIVWAQIQYHDYAVDVTRRGWVPLDCLSTWNFAW